MLCAHKVLTIARADRTWQRRPFRSRWRRWPTSSFSSSPSSPCPCYSHRPSQALPGHPSCRPAVSPSSMARAPRVPRLGCRWRGDDGVLPCLLRANGAPTGYQRREDFKGAGGRGGESLNDSQEVSPTRGVVTPSSTCTHLLSRPVGSRARTRRPLLLHAQRAAHRAPARPTQSYAAGCVLRG